MVETLLQRLLGQPSNLLIRVSQPSDRGGISRVSPLDNLLFPSLLAALLLLQHGQGLFRGDGVGDITEADTLDEFLRGKVADELPQGLASSLGVEVPDRVGDGGGCEVDDSLFRTGPSELRIADDWMRCRVS